MIFKLLTPEVVLYYIFPCFVGYVFSKILSRYFLLIALQYSKQKKNRDAVVVIYWIPFCQLAIIVGVLFLITCINPVLTLPFLIGFLFSSMLNLLPNKTFKLKKQNIPRG